LLVDRSRHVIDDPSGTTDGNVERVGGWRRGLGVDASSAAW